MGIPADPSKRSAKPKVPTAKVSTAKATTPKASPPTVSPPKVAAPKVSAPRKSRSSSPPRKNVVAAQSDATHVPSSAEARHQRIAVTAYFLAEARGFEPGHDHEDWFTAERLIDSAGAE